VRREPVLVDQVPQAVEHGVRAAAMRVRLVDRHCREKPLRPQTVDQRLGIPLRGADEAPEAVVAFEDLDVAAVALLGH
jgi:hypothetical protein